MSFHARTRALPLAILATFLLVGPVAAGDFRGDGSVNVAAGETVDDDLYVAAGSVTIAGTVNGDATVAGGAVTVSGTVNGSLNVAGGTVDVLGDVTGAVRVSGGTVRIAGTVGRDLVLFGGTATLESGAEVGGDLAGGTGTLTVIGTVAGDLLAGAGSIELAGTVEGSVEVGVGTLDVGPNAIVGGGITYTSEREATIADGAQITGAVERRDPATAGGGSPIANNPVVSYLGLLLGMLVLGWGLLAIRPRLVAGSADTLRNAPLPALGIGFVALIGQFVLLVLLVIVAGVLAIAAGALGAGFFVSAIVVLLLIILLILLSSVPVAMAIGRAILPDASLNLAYLAGAAILCLILAAAGFVPVLGGLLFLLVWILGLGAYVRYTWSTRNEPWLPPGSVVAPPTAAAPAA